VNNQTVLQPHAVNSFFPSMKGPVHSGAYMHLIIVLVHTGVVSLQDELLLEVHVALILNVLREPLLRAVGAKQPRQRQQAFGLHSVPPSGCAAHVMQPIIKVLKLRLTLFKVCMQTCMYEQFNQNIIEIAIWPNAICKPQERQLLDKGKMCKC